MKLLLLLYGLMLPFTDPAEWKKIEHQKMTFLYRFEEDTLQVKMSAPTTGWLACGFNTRPGLTGTNLIMIASTSEGVKYSDRYVQKPGDHRSIKELGGIPALLHTKAQEQNGSTTCEFRIPTYLNDPYHKSLQPGSAIHLLLAYSQSEDFDHHSIMRTEIKIQL